MNHNTNCASPWILTDDTTSQYIRSLDFLNTVFELYQVCKVADVFKVAHGTVDVRSCSREEIYNTLRLYGYENVDDFVEQTSPEIIDKNEDGSLNRNSPYYIIDWQLIAEMIFEEKALSEYLVDGKEWKDSDSAALYVRTVISQ